MSLKIGITGLPNVGKSTLFNALTRKKVDISNYPFCTIEPNIGVVEVPDERLWKLTTLSKSKKTIPAVVEFVDIAGLVKGAAEGEGLGNKFLSHIKEVDAIAEVVRVFEDPEIIHVAGAPNPTSDIEVLEYELMLKDLETVTKRMDSAQSDTRARKKGAEERLLILQKIEKGLGESRLVSRIENELNVKEQETFAELNRELQLLTSKPIIYIFNVSEKQVQGRWEPDDNPKIKIGSAPRAAISAKIESELSELLDTEKKEYLETLGLEESGLDRLIRIGYKTLGLITFFTTGEDETRAWTIPRGSTAPRAGRAIHSDFEEKFIGGEIIQWEQLLKADSWCRAREQGFLRTEGKEYAVQDGDVIEFKI